ncbi:hypothetical protein LCGC14_2088060, partial [marine sediment metagenome]
MFHNNYKSQLDIEQWNVERILKKNMRGLRTEKL